jgi:hypothetical protein
MSLQLGTYSDPEDLKIENKAIHISFRGLESLHEDDIFNILMTGRWTNEFKELNENNLIEYISLILPKYLACYANAGVDGELRLGVDDTCEITGFPIIGDIPKERIKASIVSTIKENISCEMSLDEIIKLIEIEYIPLLVDKKILSNESERYFMKFSEDIRKYNDEMDEYTIKHGLYLIEHRKYTQKLEKMLNTTRYRLELSEFIKSKSDSSEKLIEALESIKYIKLKEDNIYQDRGNKKRVFYWIAKFRDKMGIEVALIKPDKPLYPSLYHPKQILGNLPCMRLKFLENNHNLKYYVIKVTCNVSKIGPNVKYRVPYNSRWLYRTRIDNVEIKLGDRESSPGCI